MLISFRENCLEQYKPQSAGVRCSNWTVKFFVLVCIWRGGVRFVLGFFFSFDSMDRLRGDYSQMPRNGGGESIPFGLKDQVLVFIYFMSTETIRRAKKQSEVQRIHPNVTGVSLTSQRWKPAWASGSRWAEHLANGTLPTLKSLGWLDEVKFSGKGPGIWPTSWREDGPVGVPD